LIDRTGSTELPDAPIATVLYSDLTRTRKALAGKGITYGINYTGDVLGNLTSGVRQSAHYDGLLEAYADIDCESLVGWRGLTFHVNAYQIHGSSITADIGSIVSVSNIEAFPSTRLDEAWFEQKLLNQAASVRFGELAIDSEFLIAESASRFVASTFGWTTLSSDNLPFGGPIYPFAAPGIRVAAQPTSELKLMAGVYNDDPIGPCPKDLDPGQCNEHGLEFRLGDPPLLLVEGAYDYDQDSFRLPGSIKLGGWYDFRAVEGQSADSGGDPIPSRLLHHGNYGLYVVLDQLLYRWPGRGDASAASMFLRVVASPSDRNRIHAYADAGVVFTGVVPHRPNDVLGIGFAYSGLIEEPLLRGGSWACIGRNCEFLLEINYAAEIMPGLVLQPLLQYIHNPGGGLSRTHDHRMEDALIFGVRTAINY
jgi:porin